MEAVGQLPESLRTEGRTALAHSSPTRRPAVVERGRGKGALRGPWVGETGWGWRDGLRRRTCCVQGALRPWSETCWAKAGPGDLGGQDSKPGECTAGSEAARGLESRARATGLT